MEGELDALERDLVAIGQSLRLSFKAAIGAATLRLMHALCLSGFGLPFEMVGGPKGFEFTSSSNLLTQALFAPRLAP